MPNKMRENTPPRIPEIEDSDENYMEEIAIEDGQEPDDMDDDELEEVTLDELEHRLGLSRNPENGDADDNDDEDEDDELAARIANTKDDAVLTFEKHAEPVFACSLHPTYDWAVTGGEDDRAYVWNTNTGEILYEITDHKDTVTEAHFSHDGLYLATGDLAGELLVFKVSEQRDERPILTKVWEYSMFEMSWMFWHRAAHVLLAGSDSGEVYMWRIPSGDCKILPGQASRCESADLSGDGKKLLTVYMDGLIRLWDLKLCQVLMEVNAQHPMGLGDEVRHAVVACERNSPLYLCAEGDGKMVFCSNNGPVNTLKAEHSIECVAFAPATSDMKLFACGSLDGDVSIWDYSNYSLRTMCQMPSTSRDGVLRLKWLNDNTILTAHSEGTLNAFDVRSGALKFTLSGHYMHVYEMFYKPQSNLLLTVSEDKRAKIFKVPQLGD